MQNKFIKEIYKDIKKGKKNGNWQILKASSANGIVHEPMLMGKEIIPNTQKLIQEANEEVLLIGFQMHANCDASEALITALEILNQKAQQENRKIRVRILINSMEGLASKLFKTNAPSKEQFKNAHFENLDFQYCEHPHMAFGSYHSKLVVIDGKRAIIPSGDFKNDKNYKKREGCEGQIDISTTIEGGIVSHIREDFIDAWRSLRTQPLDGEKLVIPDVLEKNSSELPNNLDLGHDDINDVPMLYLSKAANGYFIKRSQLSPTILALIKAINMAESSIKIMTPNFNIPEVMCALSNATTRGVTVELIMSKARNGKRENAIFMGGDNEIGVKNLFTTMRNNARSDLSKLHVRWNIDRESFLDAPDQSSVHAKMVCIDEQLLLTGSSVLDQFGAYYPREADIFIESKQAAEQYINKIFNPVFDKGAEIFVDQDGQFIFTIQEVLKKLLLTTKNLVTLLEHKKQTLSVNIEESVMINSILGDKDQNNDEDTLCELQTKTEALLEKNSEEITKEDIENLIQHHQKITQKINETNLANFAVKRGVFYQIKTFLSNILRNFLNLREDLEFAKNLTTHSLMNHLNEEIVKTNSYLETIAPHYQT